MTIDAKLNGRKTRDKWGNVVPLLISVAIELAKRASTKKERKIKTSG